LWIPEDASTRAGTLLDCLIEFFKKKFLRSRKLGGKELYEHRGTEVPFLITDLLRNYLVSKITKVRREGDLRAPGTEVPFLITDLLRKYLVSLILRKS
jgi:hypothetical protein